LIGSVTIIVLAAVILRLFPSGFVGIGTSPIASRLAKTSPLARFVEPEDVAEATVFLGSDAAASVTGEDFNVSAGLAMY